MRGIAGIAAMLCLCSCGGGLVAISRGQAPMKFSHPGLATEHAVYLPVYRSTPEGLLVGGLYPDAPVDPNRNPGTVLKGLNFTADPSVHGSYLWKFTDGVTLLDGACDKTDVAGIRAALDRPGRNSAQFVTFLYADQRPWAPPAVHVFNRAQKEPTDCANTILSDPAFAPK